MSGEKLGHVDKALELIDQATQVNSPAVAAQLTAEAQVHATLALVEQKKAANLIVYIREIDDSHGTYGPIAPQIREALGLE